MKKRLSSLFLSVCITLTVCFTLSTPAKADGYANLSFVADVSDSGTNIGVSLPFGETGPLPSGSGNGWSYDGPNHTLTLNNFRGEFLGYTNRYDDSPVTIVLQGNNTFAYAGTRELNGAIEFSADVIIRGEGSLTVTSGMMLWGNLTLESGTIVTTGTKENRYQGLNVEKTVTVNGGSLTAAPGGGTLFNPGISCKTLIMTGGKVTTTRTDEYSYIEDAGPDEEEIKFYESMGMDPSNIPKSSYCGLKCQSANLSGGELSVTGYLDCNNMQLSPVMVATCTVEGHGTQRFPMENYTDTSNPNYTNLEIPWKIQQKENLINLPHTSVTITSGSTSSTPSVPTPTPVLTAIPTTSTVLLNGKEVAFDAYTINGNNYFKLRDLAYALSGTGKQFEVSWDGAVNAIMLTSSQPYTPMGGELSKKGNGTQTPVPNQSKVYLDGTEISLTAYTIQGNNYFKLRDLGSNLDFCVDWDGAKNTVIIDTAKGYTSN